MLFYNPVSGHAAFKNKLDWIVEAFQRRGILVVFYRTRREDNEAFIPFVREVIPTACSSRAATARSTRSSTS